MDELVIIAVDMESETYPVPADVAGAIVLEAMLEARDMAVAQIERAAFADDATLFNYYRRTALAHAWAYLFHRANRTGFFDQLLPSGDHEIFLDALGA